MSIRRITLTGNGMVLLNKKKFPRSENEYESFMFRDEQTKHNQAQLQYDGFLKSLVYKWNPLLSKWFITH